MRKKNKTLLFSSFLLKKLENDEKMPKFYGPVFKRICKEKIDYVGRLKEIEKERARERERERKKNKKKSCIPQPRFPLQTRCPGKSHRKTWPGGVALLVSAHFTPSQLIPAKFQDGS